MHKRKFGHNRGFTLMEIMIVMVIIGILATISVTSYERIQEDARDSERLATITVISEALEKYFDKNGEYPSCTAMGASAETISSDTLVGIDINSLNTPTDDEGTNSIIADCGDLTPGVDEFAYIGDSDSNCLTGDACLEYTLKYNSETSGSEVVFSGRRVISMTTTPSTPDVSVSTTVGSTTFSWDATSCPVGATARYQYRHTITPQGYDSGWKGTSGLNVTFDADQPTQLYSIQVQAQCYDTNDASPWSTSGTASTYALADKNLVFNAASELTTNFDQYTGTGGRQAVNSGRIEFTNVTYDEGNGVRANFLLNRKITYIKLTASFWAWSIAADFHHPMISIPVVDQSGEEVDNIVILIDYMFNYSNPPVYPDTEYRYNLSGYIGWRLNSAGLVDYTVLGAVPDRVQGNYHTYEIIDLDDGTYQFKLDSSNYGSPIDLGDSKYRLGNYIRLNPTESWYNNYIAAYVSDFQVKYY
jgi:prepilin-type N-terminal cleavage/methylation domain-containing protein